MISDKNKPVEANSKGSSKRKADDEAYKGWGDYMSRKQQKLWAQFERGKDFEPKKSNVFAGICIFVNGYTDPPADELKRLMQQHGGEFHSYETSRTTHVVVSNLCHAKLVQVKPTDKIMRPQWITDSIKEGRLLPEDDYLLVKKPQGLLKYVTTEKNVQARQAPSVVDLDEQPSASKNFTSKPSDLGARSSASASKPLYVDDQPSTSSKNSSTKPSTVPTAGDPNFVKDYYSRSRLHFISTWAREMKNFVDDLKSDVDSATFSGLQELRRYVDGKRDTGGDRPLNLSSDLFVDDQQADGKVFMHLDMDCFFVSVGLRKRPDLRGQPVAVAHSSGVKGKSTGTVVESGGHKFSSCSDIASCSYEARACGVRNGMWLGGAKKLCPNLKTIPYDFEEYHVVSKKLYTIVASYTFQIEPVSCDEVYVDITSLCCDTGATPLDVATVIRRTIFDQCQCPSSAGIGPNMLVARLATKRAKPNGQYYVAPEDVRDFMAGQKLADIPGVGHEGQRKFEALNVETCEQLWSLPLSTLRQQFGAKTAENLYKFSKGIDERTVKSAVVRKSVSCDMNYGIRFNEKSDVHKFLFDFAAEVVSRLKKNRVKGRTIILKLLIRSPDAPIDPPKFLGTGMCDAVSRSTTLFVATDDREVIAKECIGLFDQISPVILDLRGIGVSIQKLESTNSVDVGADSSTIRKFMAGTTKNAAVACSKDTDTDVILLSDDSNEPTVDSVQARDEPHRAKPNRGFSSNPNVGSTTPILDRGSSRGTPPKLFDQGNYDDVQQLIIDWIKAGGDPNPTDVAMASHFLTDLIENLELCRLRATLVLLQEYVAQKHCRRWTRAYNAIVGDVQDAMITRYGIPLRIHE